MMDWTDRHCRYFHRLLTRRTRLYTEMVTTGALLHGDVPRHLDFDAVEHPLALQLGGSEPADLARVRAAGRALGLRRGQPELRLPERARAARRVRRLPDGRARAGRRLRKAMRDAVALPVTVKHRIGIDRIESYGFVRDFVGTVAEARLRGLHRPRAQRLAAGPQPEGEPRAAAAALRHRARLQARLPAR